MPETAVRIPGPDHPITIAANPRRVRVEFAGLPIADTGEALTLREARYPAVQYLPRQHVNMALLERSTRTSHCPYKGEANYYHLVVDGRRSADAVWTYEHPHAAVAQIAGYLAFYPDRVDSLVEAVD